mmetsp:Transcript_62908/g.73197  ORF Transcript_62908/g.73197 Transcript_62908/m.73197 type:complete len:155 (+) Transcript_62908:45-509(+)
MEAAKSIKTLSELRKFVPCVDIDPSGVYKYIQICVTLKIKGNTDSTCFIRGHGKWEYHAENFEAFQKEIAANKSLDDLLYKPNDDEEGVKIRGLLKFKCPGGGRIQHSPTEKKIFVYGYSQSYGQPDHSVATDLIKEAYPDYLAENITWSNEGY